MPPSELLDEWRKFRKSPRPFLIATAALGAAAVFIGYATAEPDENECVGKVYRLGQGPACGVRSYVSKASEHCGVAEYKSGSGEACGVESYYECQATACGWKKFGGVIDVGKAVAETCRHPNCGVERYKTCKNEVFGVATWKTCETPEHGVAQYKSCRHQDFGFEKCTDKKFWQIWKL